MENKTIPPSDDRASQRAQGKTVTSNKQGCAVRHCPDEDQVEDVDIVAQVEEEIVPCAFLIIVGAEGKEVQGLHGISYMYPSWKSQLGNHMNEGKVTHSGASPNINAENKRDMTPKKNDIFSRVRTTFADCQETANFVIRDETYADGGS